MPAGIGPERPQAPDRVFRETFLWRFSEDDAALIERFGGTVLTIAEVAGFLPGRGHGRIRAQVLAVADDLEHVARYLEALPHQPPGGLSPREAAARTEAAAWSGYLDVVIDALRREAGKPGGPGGEHP